MAWEIERKFLVKELSMLAGVPGRRIRQFYLPANGVEVVVSAVPEGNCSQVLIKGLPEGPVRFDAPAAAAQVDTSKGVIRARIIDDDYAVMTLKGQTVGITRREEEFDMPLQLAQQVAKALAGCNTISKTRYEVVFEGAVFEVDVFEDKHTGLVLCEIELKSADAAYPVPPWLGLEVSDDPRYFNDQLAKASTPPLHPVTA